MYTIYLNTMPLFRTMHCSRGSETGRQPSLYLRCRTSQDGHAKHRRGRQGLRDVLGGGFRARFLMAVRSGSVSSTQCQMEASSNANLCKKAQMTLIGTMHAIMFWKSLGLLLTARGAD